MIIRLGSTKIVLSRYLALWSALVAVFAVLGFVHDAMGGHTWSPLDYLRWSMIQWYTWAALAPMVFRLAERHPIQPPSRLEALVFHFLGALLTLLATSRAMFDPFRARSFAQSSRWSVQSTPPRVFPLLAAGRIQQALHVQAEKARRVLEPAASRRSSAAAPAGAETQLQPTSVQYPARHHHPSDEDKSAPKTCCCG